MSGTSQSLATRAVRLKSRAAHFQLKTDRGFSEAPERAKPVVAVERKPDPSKPETTPGKPPSRAANVQVLRPSVAGQKGGGWSFDGGKRPKDDSRLFAHGLYIHK